MPHSNSFDISAAGQRQSAKAQLCGCLQEQQHVEKAAKGGHIYHDEAWVHITLLADCHQGNLGEKLAGVCEWQHCLHHATSVQFAYIQGPRDSCMCLHAQVQEPSGICVSATLFSAPAVHAELLSKHLPALAHHWIVQTGVNPHFSIHT